MKFVYIAVLVLAISCQKMLITPEYTEYLKKHVDWEVADYEDNIFRGWTEEEAKALLGDDDAPLNVEGELVADTPVPSAINWKGAGCIHAIHDQGDCGSCWAFATASVVSDRCCIQKQDYD